MTNLKDLNGVIITGEELNKRYMEWVRATISEDEMYSLDGGEAYVLEDFHNYCELPMDSITWNQMDALHDNNLEEISRLQTRNVYAVVDATEWDGVGAYEAVTMYHSMEDAVEALQELYKTTDTVKLMTGWWCMAEIGFNDLTLDGLHDVYEYELTVVEDDILDDEILPVLNWDNIDKLYEDYIKAVSHMIYEDKTDVIDECKYDTILILKYQCGGDPTEFINRHTLQMLNKEHHDELVKIASENGWYYKK